MATLDWSDPAPTSKPGIYYVEVGDAVEKISKKGDPYIKLALVALDWGRELLCDDILMLTGGGRGIGTAKLKILGVPEGQPELQAGELIGKRAYVAVDIQVDKWEEKTFKRLKVDIDQGVRCGYWPESEPPPAASVRKPSEPIAAPASTPYENVDDIPF